MLTDALLTEGTFTRLCLLNTPFEAGLAVESRFAQILTMNRKTENNHNISLGLCSNV